MRATRLLPDTQPYFSSSSHTTELYLSSVPEIDDREPKRHIAQAIYEAQVAETKLQASLLP